MSDERDNDAVYRRQQVDRPARRQSTQPGADTSEGRAGQPAEVAPCYEFVSAEDAFYIGGQVLHPNGDFISS